MRKDRSGFSVVALAVVVLVVAAIIGAGWYVAHRHVQKATESAAAGKRDKTAPASDPNVSYIASDPKGFLTYANRALGVQFTYPADWGKVKAATTDGAKGAQVLLSFETGFNVTGVLYTRDYQAQGRDGVCNEAPGLYPGTSFADYVASVVPGDYAANSDAYKGTVRILESMPDRLVQERFEAGEQTGLGVCPGVTLLGTKPFNEPSKYTGIGFAWSDVRPQGVPIGQFDLYKANPDDFMTAANRQNFMNLVHSATTL